MTTPNLNEIDFWGDKAAQRIQRLQTERMHYKPTTTKIWGIVEVDGVEQEVYKPTTSSLVRVAPPSQLAVSVWYILSQINAVGRPAIRAVRFNPLNGVLLLPIGQYQEGNIPTHVQVIRPVTSIPDGTELYGRHIHSLAEDGGRTMFIQEAEPNLLLRSDTVYVRQFCRDIIDAQRQDHGRSLGFGVFDNQITTPTGSTDLIEQQHFTPLSGTIIW